MSSWWNIFNKKINSYVYYNTHQHTITNPNYNTNTNTRYNFLPKAFDKHYIADINPSDAPVFLNKKEYTELPTNIIHRFIWVSVINPLVTAMSTNIKYIGFAPAY